MQAGLGPSRTFPGEPENGAGASSAQASAVQELLTLALESQPVPFAVSAGDRSGVGLFLPEPTLPDGAEEPEAPRAHRVLIVDDDAEVRGFCRELLEIEGLHCAEAEDGHQGLKATRAETYDLVLLDVDMPVMTGFELLRHLRDAAAWPHLKVIMFSGRATGDELAHMLVNGADDYLTKPFSIAQLCSRVKAALRRKDAQERAERLNRRLLTSNQQLERTLLARDNALVHAQKALVLGLAELVAYRDMETGAHLTRVQRYSCYLAEEAARHPAFAGQVDDHYLRMLECCAPLHDIGKVGLPDHILLKPGRLDASERIIMQSHTIMGADTLGKVAGRHGAAVEFLQMAIDVARGHHERYDGAGYPDRLAGEAIPLAARLVAIADVYDALRSHRSYKPALSHSAVLELMGQVSAGHFDPQLFEAFQRCAGQFDRIYRDTPG